MATADSRMWVWWDVDNCPLPTDLDCNFIVDNIENSLARVGHGGRASAFAYGVSYHLPIPVRQILSHSMYLGWTRSAEEMKFAMINWAEEHPDPANYLLIANDIKFYSSTIDELRKLNNNILLAVPHLDLDCTFDSTVADQLQTASYVWDLRSLVCGGLPSLTHGYIFEVEEEDRSDESFAALIPPSPRYTTTSIWWDIGECPVPSGRDDSFSITMNIATALSMMDYPGSMSIEAVQRMMDYSGPPITIFISTPRIPFSYNPNYFTFVSTSCSTEEMIASMNNWAENNPAPANCLLISGDGAYSSTLLELRSKNYKILLAHPKEVSTDLVAAASCVWLWSSLSSGGLPYSNGSVLEHGNHQEANANLEGTSSAVSCASIASECRCASPKSLSKDIPIRRYDDLGLEHEKVKRKGQKKRRSLGLLDARLIDLIEALASTSHLTSEEEILVAKHLFNNHEDLDLFFMLPDEKRLVMARMVVSGKI